MTLLDKIKDSIALGYQVEFRIVLGHSYIECRKNNNSYTTCIPDDHHFNENQIINIIDFNIERIKEELSKNEETNKLL